MQVHGIVFPLDSDEASVVSVDDVVPYGNVSVTSSSVKSS